MKIAIVLMLAHYFHGLSEKEVGKLIFLILPIILIAIPAAFIVRQPDLGTAITLVLISAAIFFAAGVRIWKFAVLGVASLGALPIGWQFLHVYQKNRILTFLDPEKDPLGAGYHIIQSKIALGSGGLTGKGFLKGPHSHNDFLPEIQTDFIFTMLAEEFGLFGGLLLIGLYALILMYGLFISITCKNQFGRLVAIGITATFFVYIFINIAMVTGLLPVVGVPLPLVSYGGTAMMTLLIGFGLLLGVNLHRDVEIER